MEGHHITFVAFNPSLLAGVHGIYAFFGDRRPVYVGQSIDIGRRLREHLSDIWETPDGMYAGKWGAFKEMVVFVRRSRTSRDYALLSYLENRIYRVMCMLYSATPRPNMPGYVGRPPCRMTDPSWANAIIQGKVGSVAA